MAARLPADAGKPPRGIDGGAHNRHGIHRVVCGRVPGRGGARRGVERGEAEARGATDGGETAPDIDRAAHHREGTDHTIRIGIPRGGSTGRGVERGNVVTRRAADARESPTGIDGGSVARNRESLDRIVRVWVPSGIHGTVGLEVYYAVARERAGLREIPGDVIATRSVRHASRHAVVQFGEDGDGLPGGGVEGHAETGVRPEIGESPGEVNLVGGADHGVDRAIGHPGGLAGQGRRIKSGHGLGDGERAAG